MLPLKFIRAYSLTRNGVSLRIKHISRILAIGGFVCGAALFSFQCIEVPPSPVLPSLDVQGSIPLVDRRFSIEDFASKDTAFVSDGNGGLVYSTSQSFDPIPLDTISVQPQASSQQVTLGTFTVQTPSIPPVDVPFPLSGTVIVPATGFSYTPGAIGPLASFEYIEFESGTLTLEVQNGLPVDVSFPDTVKVRNDQTSAPVDTNTVASFAITGSVAANGGSQTQQYDLAGVTLRSGVFIPSITINTPGSGGNPVNINSGTQLRILFTISNATVRAAKARIPSQPIITYADSTFVIDDSVSISSAYFGGGSFSVQIQNNINVDVSMYLRFAQLQDAVTGMPFEINHTFNGIGTFNIPVDASTLKFQSLIDSIGTRATFTIGVSTISNADSSREIRSTDNVQIQIVPGPPLTVKSVTGRIKPTTLDFASGASGFDLGDVSNKFQGSFSFDSVQIAVSFESSSGFPTDYDLNLVAMNRSTVPPKVDSLSIPPPQGSVQHRFYPSNNQATRIVLDNSSGLNTFLSKFFPTFPDTFIVRGSMTVNPPDVFASGLKETIYDTSNVYSSVDLWFPVALGINNASVWDTVDINSSDKFPKDFATSSQQGTIYFDVENGIPLSFSFRAALLQRAGGGVLDTLLFIPTDGPRMIDAAAVDGNGVVTGPSTSRFSISLTGPNLQEFGSADLMWIDLGVATSNGGSVVKVQNTQTIHVRASANVVYRVGDK